MGKKCVSREMSFDGDSHSFGLIITFFSTAVVAKYVRPSEDTRKQRGKKSKSRPDARSPLVLASTNEDKCSQVF